MSGDDLTVLPADSEGELRRALDNSLGAVRQRRFRRFVLAALGAVPWIGGLISATAAVDAESEQNRTNEIHQEWLEEHRDKLRDLTLTLAEIIQRIEAVGQDMERRVQSDDYLVLVRKAFRAWDQADTKEKREYLRNLLANAGATTLCSDDLVRLFIQWLDFYHEAHTLLRCESSIAALARLVPIFGTPCMGTW